MTEQVAKRRAYRALQIGVLLLEAYGTAEVVWYYLHAGDSTLHGAIRSYWVTVRERVVEDEAVTETREMIRDLPETEQR